MSSKHILLIFLQQKLHSFNSQSSVKPVEHRYAIISLRSSEMTHQLEAWFHPRGRLLGPAPQKTLEKMAASLLRLSQRLSPKNMGLLSRNSGSKSSNVSRLTQGRTVVSTSSGAILPKPDKVSFFCDFSTCTTE